MHPAQLFRAVVIPFFAAASLPALGHHSTASFDMDRTLSLVAVVTKVEWANPHVYIQLTSNSDSGSVTQWMIEGGPPNLMARSGWSSRSLDLGESVTVVAHPLRDREQNIALGVSFTKDDGTVLPMSQAALVSELATPEIANASRADSIFGRWITIWDAELVAKFLDPLTTWSVTNAGRVAVEEYDATINPSKDCNFEKPPFAVIWPGARDILMVGEQIHILSELTADRIIYMDTDSHDGASYSPGGHSIGRFEGTTLVVDTDYFEEHRRGLARGLPSSRQKHLVERFELDPGGAEMVYRFHVDDPVYLSEPMTGAIRFAHSPDLELERIECDPAIASRYLEYEEL